MKKIITLVIIAISLSLQAQDAEIYTLQKCIDLALKNNFSIVASELQARNKTVQMQQAGANALPYLSAYGNQGISTGKSINPYTNTFINQEVTTGQYGINGGMTLFSGLYNYNTMRQAMYANKAGEMDLKQARLDVSIQVTLAYLQVLNNQELLNQAVSQMQATQAQIERLSVLDKNDAISPSVLYDTKGQLSNDKIYLVNIKSSLVSAKLNLGQLLNITFSSAATFEGIELMETNASAPDAKSLYADVSKTLPALHSATLQKQSTLKGLHASRGLIFPTISLNASLGTNYSSAASTQKVVNVFDASTDAYVTVGATPYLVYQPQYEYSNEKINFTSQLKNNLNTYVGIGVQMNLFNGLRTRSQIAYAKTTYQLADAQQKNTETKYKALIEQLSNDLETSIERCKILQEQVNDYNESFRIATAKFEKGALATYEFIISKTNFEKATANLITARYEYTLRNKILTLYKEQK